jgi:ubiquitin carboxyl-terminal hydrolase L3
VDILSTDEWALDMVPRPVLGVLMVFPIKEASEAHRAEEKARVENDGQTLSPAVWYTKQFVGNACGTVGLLHVIANARASEYVELDRYN